MPRTRLFALAFAFLTTAALLPAGGCSSDKSTNPPTVSGPTFSFTFPQTGTSHSLVFISAGSWNYRCIPHTSSGMNGTVVVEASSPNDSQVVTVAPGDALVFDPVSVSIKPGGTVRWVNASTTMFNHTVTR